ncbi:hypothetical protein A3709_20050 [Halioglobus sp. HI00S01]|nr:hypothetical protein A3709_20050 [Halioglobus sp. HI00S01]
MTYKDFPGMREFVHGEGYGYYRTWQEASAAAQNLGITTYKQYRDMRSRDPRLYGLPDVQYPDFPGYKVFLGTATYETWKEAAAACLSIGITSFADYPRLRTLDLRLPSCLSRAYPDYPGPADFFSGLPFYASWQESAMAARQIGIRSRRAYAKKRAGDIRLPLCLPRAYRDRFPGYPQFFSYPDSTELSKQLTR